MVTSGLKTCSLQELNLKQRRKAKKIISNGGAEFLTIYNAFKDIPSW